MKKLLMIFALVGSIMAAELTLLQIPLTSRHYSTSFERIENLNEDNQGIFVNFKADKVKEVEFKVGTFKNSLNKQSFFFGIEKGVDFKYGRVGATGGLATNYDKPVLAGVFAEAYGIGVFGVRVDYTYEFENEMNIIGLSLTYKF